MHIYMNIILHAYIYIYDYAYRIWLFNTYMANKASWKPQQLDIPTSPIASQQQLAPGGGCFHVVRSVGQGVSSLSMATAWVISFKIPPNKPPKHHPNKKISTKTIIIHIIHYRIDFLHHTFRCFFQFLKILISIGPKLRWHRPDTTGGI